MLVSSHAFSELNKEKIEAHRAYYARELVMAKIGRYAVAGVATAAAVYGALQFFGVIKKTVSFTEAEGKALKDIVREHANSILKKQQEESAWKQVKENFANPSQLHSQGAPQLAPDKDTFLGAITKSVSASGRYLGSYLPGIGSFVANSLIGSFLVQRLNAYVNVMHDDREILMRFLQDRTKIHQYFIDIKMHTKIGLWQQSELLLQRFEREFEKLIGYIKAVVYRLPADADLDRAYAHSEIEYFIESTDVMLSSINQIVQERKSEKIQEALRLFDGYEKLCVMVLQSISAAVADLESSFGIA